MNQKLEEKLRKLLALAGSDNLHEAAMAIKKAQQLAIENNIELSSINTVEEDCGKNRVETGRCNLGIYHKFVVWIILDHFDVRIITGKAWNAEGSKYLANVTFVGSREANDMAAWVYSYLTETFDRLWKIYKRREQAPPAKRMSYLAGVRQGLDEKLREQRAELEAELVKDPNAYALQLASQEQRLELAMDRLFPNRVNARPLKIEVTDWNARYQGAQDGRKINLHRQITGGQSGLLLEDGKGAA